MTAGRLTLSMALVLGITVAPCASQTTQVDSDHRSRGTAIALGYAGIAVPLGLGLAALGSRSPEGLTALLFITSGVLGPAPGLFYAGNRVRAWKGMGFRTLTMVAAAGGAALIAGDSGSFGGNENDGEVIGTAIVLAASGLIIKSWVEDLREIPISLGFRDAGAMASPYLAADGGIGTCVTIRW